MKTMKKLSKYQEALLDPRWQKRRLEALQNSNWQCQECQDSTSTLHVHHKIYIYGRQPWEYNNSQLLVCCEIHHKEAHSLMSELMLALSYLETADFNAVIGYIKGLTTDGPDAPLLIENWEQAAGFGAAFGFKADDVLRAVNSEYLVTFKEVWSLVNEQN